MGRIRLSKRVPSGVLETETLSARVAPPVGRSPLDVSVFGAGTASTRPQRRVIDPPSRARESTLGIPADRRRAQRARCLGLGDERTERADRGGPAAGASAGQLVVAGGFCGRRGRPRWLL